MQKYVFSARRMLNAVGMEEIILPVLISFLGAMAMLATLVYFDVHGSNILISEISFLVVSLVFTFVRFYILWLKNERYGYMNVPFGIILSILCGRIIAETKTIEMQYVLYFLTGDDVFFGSSSVIGYMTYMEKIKYHIIKQNHDLDRLVLENIRTMKEADIDKMCASLALGQEKVKISPITEVHCRLA